MFTVLVVMMVLLWPIVPVWSEAFMSAIDFIHKKRHISNHGEQHTTKSQFKNASMVLSHVLINRISLFLLHRLEMCSEMFPFYDPIYVRANGLDYASLQGWVNVVQAMIA